MNIDFEEEPPMFKITDTHYAATWLLHEDAPKIDMPSELCTRIEVMLKDLKAEKNTEKNMVIATTNTSESIAESSVVKQPENKTLEETEAIDDGK